MKCRQFLFFLVAVFLIPAFVQAEDEIYRIGIPKGDSVAVYNELFESLKTRHFVVDNNLQVVSIDLNNYQTEAGKERIRREISERCDLFFTTGAHLEVLFNIEIKTPLLFLGTTELQQLLPESIKKNTTGIFRASTTAIFKQSAQMLNAGQQAKLGIVFFNGSKLETRVPRYYEICKELGVDLIVTPYEDKKDIERAMKECKMQGVDGILLFPPGIRKGDLGEFVKWQNRLKLPVIGQLKQHVKRGLMGGLVVDQNKLFPALADYTAKILKGRIPGSLPVKYFGSISMLNLDTVSRLGIEIPSEVLDKAEIVGIAHKSKGEKKESKPLVAGNYVLAMPINLPLTTKKSIISSLGRVGYEPGSNLKILPFDIKARSNPEKKQQLKEQLGKAGVVLVPGNILASFVQLPELKTPVCFIATKETSAIIPDNLKQNFTGVVRGSLSGIMEMAQQMMGGAKRMAMLARSDSNMHRLINRYQEIADTFGMTIELRLYSSKAEIGPAMRKLKEHNDFILLFPPSISQNDLEEIVRWQNELQFPVLSQYKSHIEAGLLGGPVVDLQVVMPKAAEYIDKLLQGRDPSSLPAYFFMEKYVINLRAASILQREIPDSITLKAEIIR